VVAVVEAGGAVDSGGVMLLESKVDERCRGCISNHSRAFHCDGTGESRMKGEGRRWCAAFDAMPKKESLESFAQSWRV